MKDKSKGIIFIILATISFSSMSAATKVVKDVGALQKSFFTSIVTCVLVFIILKCNKTKLFGHKENRKFLLLRAFFGALALITTYYTIDKMVLSDAVILGKLSPFFTILMSFVLLKERVSKLQIVTLIIAFSGSLLVIKPGFNSELLPALVGVASALFAGIAYSFIRKIGNKENFFTIVFCYSTTTLLLTTPYILFSYDHMNIYELSFLLLAGVFSTLGQIFLTLGYTYGKAADISMYDYVGIIYSAIIGYGIFNELPDIYSFLGYIIIIGSSLYPVLIKRKT
ncbi:DMT family transporter [Clostridium cellulovorans]|uniref:EamA domain-containing protein n=1 Tax=Clostridium cellulovorans (strain ATCC 35296 / DSM 3052 / OCM 3 / 743B) TaxID=573061 RepID=D9SVP0_CLOC7|nr:DMT family transporter [Clostridium cellulovorans]ADL53101.1 protein of unknown function DUF6 transmembrane [Clostridium cellulovorans 743B]